MVCNSERSARESVFDKPPELSKSSPPHHFPQPWMVFTSGSVLLSGVTQKGKTSSPPTMWCL